MSNKEPLKFYDGYYHCEECGGWPAAGGCSEHPEAKICGPCAGVHSNDHGKAAHEEYYRLVNGTKSALRGERLFTGILDEAGFGEPHEE